TRHPEQAVALVPSGMGVMPPGDDAMPSTTRRAMFEPVDDSVLFLPAEGGFNTGYAEADPTAYDRYVRLRSTATRIEASRYPGPVTASRAPVTAGALGVSTTSGPLASSCKTAARPIARHSASDRCRPGR